MSYFCSKCGASRVRLWRQSHVMACDVELLCRVCAEDQTGCKFGEESKYGTVSDKIGNLVPAVPGIDGGFWGYSSVPFNWCLWWLGLPFEENTDQFERMLVPEESLKAIEKSVNSLRKLRETLENKAAKRLL